MLILPTDRALFSSQYTAIQVFMALDIWHEAYDQLCDISTELQKDFGSRIEWSKEQGALYQQIISISGHCDEVCPLEEGKRLQRHSHEAYPVDTTLRSAATIRTATKRLQKLAK